MNLNKLEMAGIFAALMLVALAVVFAFTQAAVFAFVDGEEIVCEVNSNFPWLDQCDDTDNDDDDNETPVDPCDIMPLPAQCDDDEDSGENNGGGGNTDTDVCPNDEGVQTTAPCPSDTNTGGEGGSSDGGSSGGSSGSSSGGGGGGSGGGGGGSVLGASTGGGGGSCNYLTGFIKPGADNDKEQVIRLQAFLKIFEGANVEVSGTYDSASIAAVHAFQTKYSTDVLAPWEINNSTGYVYLTTRKKINEIYCDRGQTFPLTADEQQVIEVAKQAPAVSSAPERTTTPVETPERDNTVQDEAPIVNTAGSSIMNFFRRLFDRFR